MASRKIKAHAKTRDGYSAWLSLKDYFESRGSREQFAVELNTDINALHLEYNTHGGIERYIADFEGIALLLEEAGEGLSALQKKTRFLGGINDRDYESTITICRTNPDIDFEVCTRVLMSMAKAKGKLAKYKETRKANQVQRSPGRRKSGRGRFGRNNNNKGRGNSNNNTSPQV